MQVSVLAEFLCFGEVFDLILSRLQAQGGVSLGCFVRFRSNMVQNDPILSLQHSPKTAEVGPKMAPT